MRLHLSKSQAALLLSLPIALGACGGSLGDGGTDAVAYARDMNRQCGVVLRESPSDVDTLYADLAAAFARPPRPKGSAGAAVTSIVSHLNTAKTASERARTFRIEARRAPRQQAIALMKDALSQEVHASREVGVALSLANQLGIHNCGVAPLGSRS